MHVRRKNRIGKKCILFPIIVTNISKHRSVDLAIFLARKELRQTILVIDGQEHKTLIARDHMIVSLANFRRKFGLDKIPTLVRYK